MLLLLGLAGELVVRPGCVLASWLIARRDARVLGKLVWTFGRGKEGWIRGWVGCIMHWWWSILLQKSIITVIDNGCGCSCRCSSVSIGFLDEYSWMIKQTCCKICPTVVERWGRVQSWQLQRSMWKVDTGVRLYHWLWHWGQLWLVIGAVIRLSHRSAVGEEKVCMLVCHWVRIDAIDSVNEWQKLVKVKYIERLVLLTRFIGKVTMVMMTLLAFICRKDCNLSTG